MAIASARSLVEILSRQRLLEPAQLDELTRTLAARPADPLPLARELLQRGWLTAYQVNQLFQGQAGDLVLGRYVLLDRLGEGGMGQVFKAREQRLGRIVALKILRKEHLAKPDTVRRFYQEIEAVGRLSHPNIVHAYDAEQVGDAHLFAMEYVEGIDLSRLVKQSGPLPVAQACDYVRQAALGLQHIHEHSMVHRDVKPANLMRANHGGIVKILDMGLARLLDDGMGGPTPGNLTRLGVVMGTVDYLAPEQALNSRRADIRSDLYGLGCTFYFLLTGRVPFSVAEPMAKLIAHSCEEAVAVEQLRPETPAAVAALVRKLMAKRPTDRYQIPTELVQDIAALTPPPLPPQAILAELAVPARPRRPQPHRGKFWIAALVVLALLLSASAAYLVRSGGGLLTPSNRTPDASEAFGEREITNSLGMKLVRIPAGEFDIGSPRDEPHRHADEGPSHHVTLTQAFYLSVYPVTVGDFRAFAESRKPGETRPDPSWLKPGWVQDDDYPVAGVNWNEAKTFCDWLSKKEGHAYRLPTEAEWEYACRAGSTSAYFYGPDAKKLDDYAWHRGNSDGKAHPVGRLKPNDWGLHDMHGNLWEWCGDYYDAKFYEKLGIEDPRGPAQGGRRVLRGGSWKSAPHECRSARRKAGDPGAHRNDRGFRVVLVPPG